MKLCSTVVIKVLWWRPSGAGDVRGRRATSAAGAAHIKHSIIIS